MSFRLSSFVEKADRHVKSFGCQLALRSSFEKRKRHYTIHLSGETYAI